MRGGGILSLKNPKNVLALALKSRFNKPKEKHNKSFTLAEVLISLVIIGIIAAITVPMIMTNHKKVETAAKLKKFYSNLSNAVRLTEIEVGIPVQEWIIDVNLKEKTNLVYEKLMATETKTIHNTKPLECENNVLHYSYLLPDGMLMMMEYDEMDDFYVSVDVNGEKAPNECGRDIFTFVINASYYDFVDSNTSTKTIVFYPDGGGSNNSSLTREELIKRCGQSNTMNRTCTALLAEDGWEFKDDYPLRL